MTETGRSSDTTPFWQFSLQFYRQSGVSDACIALQDDCGVDVNLLLFLFWLAAVQQLLPDAAVRQLDGAVHDWRNLTIVPIRDVRRRLKGAATAVDPAQQEAFRSKVKAIELDAERLQQSALYAFARSGPLGAPAAPAAAARGNLAAYQRVMVKRFPQHAVDVLLGAFDGIDHAAFADR